MAEHQHGSMNTEAHEKVFSGVVTFVARTVIGIFVFLIILAMVNG